MLPTPSRTQSWVSFSNTSTPASWAFTFFARAATFTCFGGAAASTAFFSTRAASFSRLAARSGGTGPTGNGFFWA